MRSSRSFPSRAGLPWCARWSMVGMLWAASFSVPAGEASSAKRLFIDGSFAGQAPRPSLLWLTGELKDGVRKILGHDMRRLRLRYWRQGDRSVWLLDEVGKEKPITFGVVVDSGRIERLRVLAYRESRGWQIREAFFTDQFAGATLASDEQLDRPIDNISGATISVRAAERIARLALFLDRSTRGPSPGKGGR